jgi:hypothetical protein
MIALHLICIAIGLFMIAVAVFNWDDWFFDAESRVIEMIGGDGAVRVYWFVGGVMLIVATVVHWIWGKDLGWWW